MRFEVDVYHSRTFGTTVASCDDHLLYDGPRDNRAAEFQHLIESTALNYVRDNKMTLPQQVIVDLSANVYTNMAQTIERGTTIHADVVRP
jgi:hypothetical protein